MTFFVVKKKGGQFNTYSPISYFDDNNNFRGIACFTDLAQATIYMQKYEEKLARKHFDNVSNNGKKRHRNTNSDKSLKIFIQNEIPVLTKYYSL